jgi:Protochlamydia outer membrane protein
MKTKSTFLILGLCWAMAQSTSAQAFFDYFNFNCCCEKFNDYCENIEAEVDISTGWRNDRITTENRLFSRIETFIAAEEIKIRNLDVWQIGGKGRVRYDNWYLRAYGYYGWANNGKFRQNITDVTDVLEADLHGKVHEGNTMDGAIGGGYLFDFEDNLQNIWSIGPTIGWAYHEQKVNIRRERLSEFALFRKLRYTAQWYGPWAGVDLTFRSCQFIMNLGYEYHWTQFHGDLRESIAPGIRFNMHQKSNHGYGNVAYFDGKWVFYSNWTVGIGLKYEGWKANKGHAHLTSFGIDEKLKHARWTSGQVTLDLGYAY